MTGNRIVIGVDGGQSTTLTVLARENGEILSSAVTGPVNHIHEPGGLERQYNTLHTGYEQVMQAAGLPLEAVACAFLGVTGSGDLDTIRRAVPAEILTVQGDLPIALAGAIPDLTGCVVLSGTGSAAYGQNEAGETLYVGGMGYFAGDEGSGYDIARRGIQAICQADDGRGPRTALSAAILAHFACESLKQLHRKIYSGELTRDMLATASAVVGRSAAQGDPVSIEILRQAGLELGKAAAAVVTRLGQLDRPVPVAPVGGVFHAGGYVIGPMISTVWEKNPQAYVVTPRYVPAIGAVLMALRSLKVEIGEQVFANLDRTLDRIRIKEHQTAKHSLP